MEAKPTKTPISKPNGVVAGSAELPEELWRHPGPETTVMWDFMQTVNTRCSLDLKSYRSLYDWSVTHIAEFWGQVWDYVGIRVSESYQEVCVFGPCHLWNLSMHFKLRARAGSRRIRTDVSAPSIFPRSKTQLCREPAVPDG
jgi:hypothetical protein